MPGNRLTNRLLCDTRTITFRRAIGRNFEALGKSRSEERDKDGGGIGASGLR